MDNEIGIMECVYCKKYLIGYKEDFKEIWGNEICDCEIKKYKFVKRERVKDPKFYLTLIEIDLENANHHGQNMLANNIYEKITKKLILNDAQKLDISKILYKCFYDSI